MKLKCPKCKNRFFDRISIEIDTSNKFNGEAILRCKICNSEFKIDMVHFSLTIRPSSIIDDFGQKKEKTVYIIGVEL